MKRASITLNLQEPASTEKALTVLILQIKKTAVMNMKKGDKKMTVIEFKKEKELQVCDSDNEKKTIENNPFLADIDKQGNIDFYAFVDTKIDGSEVRFYCYLDLNKLKQFEHDVKLKQYNEMTKKL